MKRLLTCAFLLFVLVAPAMEAQTLAAPAKAAPRAAANRTESTKETLDSSPKRAATSSSLPPGQAIVTEIYADEALFDSANHIGTFTGHVIVNDPRFNVQSDKLTIYLSKPAAGEDADEKPAGKSALAMPRQGLEKAVAEGNVGVVRERPDEKGGPPVRSVGRAEMAIYTMGTGDVELRGTPRVQSGANTHVAMSPDTVMILENGGQLITKGPSRTEIRQQPKAGETPAAAPAAPKP